MKRILLVDGHNLLFRMFFGMPFPFYDEKQREITGTVGFVGTVVKMIKYFNATHCLVVFDGQNSLIRQQEDEEYKANRTIDYGELPDNENPFTQLQFIKYSLDFLQIGWIETENCECDDYIAQICKEYEDQIFISSTDTDFLQLVNQNVNVVNFRGKNTIVWDDNLVYQKYGINPKDFAIFKSLVGDKADNISGINKVGPKTAANIINSINEGREDKFLEMYNVNLDLINHNLKLISLPRKGVSIEPIENFEVNQTLLKTFKPIKTINEALKLI